MPDFEHGSRSARDLTLVQTARLTLRDAVDRAMPGGFVLLGDPDHPRSRRAVEHVLAEASGPAPPGSVTLLKVGSDRMSNDGKASEQELINSEVHTSAEAARAEAEERRGVAEEDRASAEFARASAESRRSSAGDDRRLAERAREAAERARVASEGARAAAESARVATERLRDEMLSALAEQYAVLEEIRRSLRLGAK